MTYFEVFSLPPKLRLDTAALEKSFYTLSRTLHPDRFASKPAAEQAEATEKSSELNDAYRTLRDPIRRTEYLLGLEGIDLEEQSVQATAAAKAAGTQKKQIVPPDLLEEAFELNMHLEEMKMGDDDPQLRADLAKAKSNFQSMLDASLASLEAEWDSWDAAIDSEDDGAKDAAKDEMLALLNRRSYLRNLVRDCEAYV